MAPLPDTTGALVRRLYREHLRRHRRGIALAVLAQPSGDPPTATPASTDLIKRGEYGVLVFGEHSVFSIPAYPLEEVFDHLAGFGFIEVGIAPASPIQSLCASRNPDTAVSPNAATMPPADPRPDPHAAPSRR